MVAIGQLFGWIPGFRRGRSHAGPDDDGGCRRMKPRHGAGTILGLLIAFPVGVLLVTLAVANRHACAPRPRSFPAGVSPVISVVLPFYAYLFGALVLGVAIGGSAAWFGQGRWRRTARTAPRRPCAGRRRPIVLPESATQMFPVARGNSPSAAVDGLIGARDGWPVAVGLAAVSAMLIYAFEDRSPWCVLGFAFACALGSLYGSRGGWPFGLVEAIWTVVR